MKCPRMNRGRRMCVCAHMLSLSLLLEYIFVSKDLIKNPVEDVEEEEGQREAGPRHSVNLFGSVDE